MENCHSISPRLVGLPHAHMPSRVLKVIETGDFWAKRTMPSIRLQGKWMLRAGIFPNQHVEITNPSPGVLLIRLLEDTVPAESKPTTSKLLK